MLIGLSGYARSGKDTFAGFLSPYGFERVAFADALRDCLYALNPIVVGDDTCAIRVADLVDQKGWEAAKKAPEVRALLQRMGTEVGRNILGPTLWVDVAMAKAAARERCVITDVRFLNEADAVRSAGGVLVRVRRPDTGPVNAHPSETELDDYPFDFYVDNDGDLEHLRSHAVTLAGLNLV